MHRHSTDDEVRRLVAKVVEIGVLSVIRNHMYSWKGQDWMQTVGVPTGLRLSGIIGRISMDVWTLEMRRLMEDNRIKAYLFEKYVDDSEIIMENLPPGSRWDGQKITATTNDAEQDAKDGKTSDQVSMDAWGAMASSVIPGLVFTVDHAANHANGRVPVLDFELWCEEKEDESNPGCKKKTVKYSFYEKEVTNPKVMDRDSAFPHRMMLATMSQEGVRRLANMSRDLSNKDKCDVLSAYMQKLKRSGYSEALRREILNAAVKTYRKQD